MNQLAHCPNCKRFHYVDLAQIAYGVTTVFCPECANLADYAREQQANPNISQGTRDAWRLIGGLAIIAGLFVAAHALDHAIEQLTA